MRKPATAALLGILLLLLPCTLKAQTTYTVTQALTSSGHANTESFSPTILWAQFGQVGVVSGASPDVRMYFNCDKSYASYGTATVIENFDIYKEQLETVVPITCNVGPMGSVWPYPVHTNVPAVTFTSGLGRTLTISADWVGGKSREGWIAESAVATLTIQ